MNFVRLGIAKASRYGVMSRPKFNVNWSVEKPAVLEKLWNDIKNHLNEPRFGEYYAFRRVFGEEAARIIGKRGQFAVPPI